MKNKNWTVPKLFELTIPWLDRWRNENLGSVGYSSCYEGGGHFSKQVYSSSISVGIGIGQ